MSKAVFGIASSEAQAEIIVMQLKDAGFAYDDISILFPDRGGRRDLAHEKHSKAPEGAAAGAGTGGVLGGALGLLAGMGALTLPGLVAAGPIVAALSVAAVGAAVGGLAGALIGMGIPEYEARQFAGKVRDGNILISVHAESAPEIRQAREIFERAGAENIATANEISVKEGATVS